MNRIRVINNTFQVLETPNLVYDGDMGLLVGGWNDPTLRGFCVKEFNTLEEAQCVAFRQSDINWYKLVSMHVDAYHLICKKVESVLAKHKFIYNIDKRLANPDDLKDITFDRVIKLGKRFSLTYDMNDIINITISNPWTENLREMANILKRALGMSRIDIVNGKIFHLIGKTDLGTTYEIKLWPTVVHNWAKWQNINCSKDNMAIKKMFEDVMKLQETIDNSLRIR
jgi:hypothetical protein